jgi:hypothetical protein
MIIAPPLPPLEYAHLLSRPQLADRRGLLLLKIHSGASRSPPPNTARDLARAYSIHPSFTLGPVPHCRGGPNFFCLHSTRHYRAAIGEKKLPHCLGPFMRKHLQGFNVNAKACRGVQEETEKRAEQRGNRKLHQHYLPQATELVSSPLPISCHER